MDHEVSNTNQVNGDIPGRLAQFSICKLNPMAMY
jgi:hypothetical protein